MPRLNAQLACSFFRLKPKVGHEAACTDQHAGSLRVIVLFEQFGRERAIELAETDATEFSAGMAGRETSSGRVSPSAPCEGMGGLGAEDR